MRMIPFQKFFVDKTELWIFPIQKLVACSASCRNLLCEAGRENLESDINGLNVDLN